MFHVTSWIAMLKDVIIEEFEDTKGAIRIRISKKKRQQKKYYRTNNDLQNISSNSSLITSFKMAIHDATWLVFVQTF
jgi:hypothetical protein